MPNPNPTAWIVRDEDGLHPETLASNKVEAMNAYCLRIMEDPDPEDMAGNWKRAQEAGARAVEVDVREKGESVEAWAISDDDGLLLDSISDYRQEARTLYLQEVDDDWNGWNMKGLGTRFDRFAKSHNARAVRVRVEVVE